MKYTILIGRVLFAINFMIAGISHFSPMSIALAYSKNIPMPEILLPISGFITFLGALSILIGYKAKWGAWAIIIFLMPAVFMMHNFWTVADPSLQRIEMSFFIKNLSLLGAAFMITYFGSGPLSVENWKK